MNTGLHKRTRLPSADELDRYIAEARRLRSEAVSALYRNALAACRDVPRRLFSRTRFSRRPISGF